MALLVQFVYVLTQILTMAIFVRAILSWFPVSRYNPVVDILYQITDPVLVPLRRILPTIGFVDITPLVAIIMLQLIGDVVFGLLL